MAERWEDVMVGGDDDKDVGGTKSVVVWPETKVVRATREAVEVWLEGGGVGDVTGEDVSIDGGVEAGVEGDVDVVEIGVLDVAVGEAEVVVVEDNDDDEVVVVVELELELVVVVLLVAVVLDELRCVVVVVLESLKSARFPCR